MSCGIGATILLPLALAAAGALLYLNTLHADFVYDDDFAVVSNKDVTGDNPISQIFVHDFWGQNLRSSTSHKSYRPVTILLFRALHAVGQYLPWKQEEDADGSSETPDPLPFHAACMAMHAFLTAQVYWLARRLAPPSTTPRSPTPFAAVAAALFAAHPIHTEAVAGVVGLADLLAASFALAALGTYITRVRGQQGVARWAALGLVVLLGWLAALSKETGVVIFGTILVLEILVPGSKATDAIPPSSLPTTLATPVTLVAAVATYVAMRAGLAGDQLVRNYRSVENPIPFSSSRITRTLTTLYLHALYARQLLLPVQLSADWSFACVPLVQRAGDPRNALSALLYAFLAVTTLVAKPWTLLPALRPARPAVSPASSTTESEGDAKIEVRVQAGPVPPPALALPRWRLWVVTGLLLGPMLPASNIFFYVGTFLAERLLLFPSVGLSFLVAERLAPSLAGIKAQKVRGGLTALALGALLAWGGAKTVARNRDWRSEAALFASAYMVCPNSAKVLLNAGILSRRTESWDASVEFQNRALEVLPGYCDPHYHKAIALLGKKQATEALTELQKAVVCPHTAVDALRNLNTIYSSWMEEAVTQRDWATSMDQWAYILALPAVQRVEEALLTWETAALTMVATGGVEDAAGVAQRMMLRALMKLGDMDPVPTDPDEEHRVRQALTEEGLDRLIECVGIRFPVIEAIGDAGGDLKSPAVKAAMYGYLDKAGPLRCHLPLKAIFGAPYTSTSLPLHTKLVNAVQKVDAYDPWMQAAWAGCLEAQGRGAEALPHAHAALVIFQDAAQRLLGGQSGDDPEGGGLPLARDGSPLEPAGAIGAAMAAQADLVALMARVGHGRGATCELQAQGVAALGALRDLTADQADLDRLLDAKAIELAMAMQAMRCGEVLEEEQGAGAGQPDHDEL